MGRLGLCLVVLLLAAVAAAGKGQSKRVQSKNVRLPRPDKCPKIQSFERGHKYSYTYDAIVESSNGERSKLTKNGMRLRCEVEIRIPGPCTGLMTVSNCTVYEGVLLKNGSIAYSNPSPSSWTMNTSLSWNPLYFHFNQGEIIKIFMARSDSSDIMNIKRGILTALQLKYEGSGMEQPIGKPVVKPEMNIFGVGNVTTVVKSIKDDYASRVNVLRDVNDYELPWSRQQWSSFHTWNEDESEITDMIADFFVENSKNLSGVASQSCEYQLNRGRHVMQSICLENRTASLFNNSFLQLLKVPLSSDVSTGTTVQLNITQTKDEKMKFRDRVSRDELIHFRKYYHEDTIMFEEQWQESFKSDFRIFNPVSAVDDLVKFPANRTTPGLFAKMGRYLSMSSERIIDNIWNEIRQKYRESELEKATNIWFQLLYGCSSVSYWCPLPQCEPSLACQEGLGSFISSTGMQSWTENIKNGVFMALSSIPNPNVTIVRTALSLCRASTTPYTVIMLGKVLARYVSHPHADLNQQSYTDAKDFLNQLLRQNCNLVTRENTEKKVKIAAMKAIGALSEQGEYAVENLVNCALNADLPIEISLNAIRALKHIPIDERSPYHTRVLAIITDDGRPVTLRLASYLLIMMKGASSPDVETILSTVMRLSESHPLKFYVRRHINSQLVLRKTSFCELPKKTIDSLLNTIREHNWGKQFDVSFGEGPYEKRYELSKPVFIPYLNQEINCSFVADAVYSPDSLVPILVNLTILTEITDRNITIFESTLDLNKLISVLQPLFGDFGIFPDQGLSQLIKMPLQQLLRPDIRDSPILRTEELQVLEKQQDEGSLAYSMLMMANKSPIQIRLFGNPIDSQQLFGLSFFKNLNIMDVMKFVDVLEKGWTFDGVLANQPILAHIANPTSIGIPHIYHIENSLFLNMNTRVAVEVKKIFLTGQGEMSIRSKTESRGTVAWIHKVQLPNGIASASGYQLNAGHNSSVAASVNVMSDSIKVEIVPLPKATEIFSLKVDEVVAKNGTLQLVEQVNSCPVKCIVGKCETATGISYKGCIRPLLDFALYLNSSGENYYEMNAEWGKKEITINQASYMSSVISFNLKKKSSPSAAGQLVIQAVARYIPSLPEAVFELQYPGEQGWLFRANAVLYRSRTSETASLITGMFASCNVSRPSGERISTNFIRILRQRPEEPLFAEFVDFFTGRESMVNDNHFSIKAGMQFPSPLGNVSAVGLLTVNGERGGYTAQVNVKKGNPDSSGTRLFVFNVTSIPTTEYGKQGFLTQMKIQEISIHGFPFVLLNTTSKVVNDSIGNVHQEFAFHARKSESSEPYFFHSLVTMKKMDNTPNAGPFALNCTYTINVAQYQLDVIAPNMKKMEIVQKLVLPENSIPDPMLHRNRQKEIRISEYTRSLNPSFYSLDMCFGMNTTAEWYLIINGTKQPRAPSKYTPPPKPESFNITFVYTLLECATCHQMIVETPLITIKSHHTNKPHYQGQEAYLDMDKSVLAFIPISEKSREFIVNHASSASDGRLKVGYVAKANRSHHNYFYEAGYRIGDQNLQALINLTWPEHHINGEETRIRFNLTCDACIPLLRGFTFKTGFAVRYSDEIPPEFIEIADRSDRFEFEFGFYEKEGLSSEYGMVYNFIRKGRDIVKFNSTVNASYSAGQSVFKYYFSVPKYRFKTELNVTLKNPESLHSDTAQRKYHVSMLGFDPEAPVFAGYWNYSKVADPSEYPDICREGYQCYRSTVEMVQVTQVANFSAYYEALGLSPQYKPAIIKANITSSRNTWKADAILNAGGNPRVLVDNLVFNSMKDVNGRTFNHLAYNRSSLYFSLLPYRWNTTYTSDMYGVHLKWKRASLDYDYRRNSDVFFNATTWEIPFKFDCNGHADLSQRQSIRYNIRKCLVRYPLIMTEPLDLTLTGTYQSLSENHMQGTINKQSRRIARISLTTQSGSGTGRVICDQTQGQTSPCNIEVTYDSNRINVNSRINSYVYNHTARGSVTGLSSWPRQGLQGVSMDMEVINHLATKSTPVVLDAIVIFNNGQNWFVNTTLNITSNFSHSFILNEGKVVLLRSIGNFFYTWITRDNLMWHMQYRKNREIDLELWSSLKLGKLWKIEGGYYKGINRPDSVFYIPTQETGKFLHALYFNYTKCNKNMSFKMKNLYQSQQGSLIKMQMKSKSSLWPFTCSGIWQNFFDKIFPETPIMPFCKGEMELDVLYDEANNSTMKFKLVRASIPILSASYNKAGNVHRGRVFCLPSDNPSCNVSLSLSDNQLQISSWIKFTNFNHSGYAKFVKSHNVKNKIGMTFDIQTNNTAKLPSGPLVFFADIKKMDGQGLFVNSSLNVTPDLQTMLLINDGEFELFYSQGNAITLFTEPCSWNVTYYSSEMIGTEFVAVVKLNNEREITGGFYKGNNMPNTFRYQSHLPSNAYVYGVFWNYSFCSEHSIVKYRMVSSPSERRLLEIESIVSINIWPFVSKTPFFLTLPWSSPCLLCLGELDLVSQYNAYDNNRMMIKALLAKSTDLFMNYTFKKFERKRGFQFVGETDLHYNIHKSSAPLLWIVNNVTYVPNKHSSSFVQIKTQGFDKYNLAVKHNYTYKPSELLSNYFVIESDFISLYSNINKTNEGLVAVIRYPNSSRTIFGVIAHVRGDDLELRNSTMRTSIATFHLERVIFTLLRSETRRCIGINMHDLDLTVMPKRLPDMTPVNLRGNARCDKNAVCSVNIRDTNNQKVRIVLSLNPHEDVLSRSDVLIRLPIIDMTWNGMVRLTSQLFENTQNISMSVINPVTLKKQPVFLTFMGDHVEKSHSGAFSGVVNWNMHFWSLPNPSIYYKPTLHVTITPTPDASATNVNLLATFGPKSRISSTVLLSSSCQSRIRFFHNKTVCLPQYAAVTTAVDLPMLQGNHITKLHSGHCHMKTNVICLMGNIFGQLTPLINVTQSLDMRLSQPMGKYVGTSNITCNLLKPLKYRYEQNVTISPDPGTNSRKFDIAMRLGESMPITCNVTALSPQGERQLMCDGLNTELFRSSMRATECLLPLPFFPDNLCISREVQMNNINADVPMARFIRLLPLMDYIFPNTTMLDLHLQRSTVTIQTTKNGKNWTIRTNSQLHCMECSKPVVIEQSISYTEGTMSMTVQMNKWNFNMQCQWTPATMALLYDMQLTAPWLEEHMHLDCPGFLQIRQLIFKVKTLGTLHKYLPININLEFNRNMERNSWDVKVRSLAIGIPQVGSGNASISADSTWKNIFVQWDVKSDKYPIWNNSVSAKIHHDDDAREWSYSTNSSSVFGWTNFTSTLDSSGFKVRNMSVGLPNDVQGINVQYKANEGPYGKLELKMRDLQGGTYICHLMIEESQRNVLLNCTKTQVGPNARVRSVTTNIANASLPITTDIGIKVLMKALSFNYTKLTDASWLNKTLNESFSISNQTILSRLTEYINNEMNELVKKVDALLHVGFVKVLMKYGSTLTPPIPSSGDVADYVNKTLSVVEVITGKRMKCGTVNGTGFLALQCNFTRAKSQTIMTQINMTTSSEGLPIANLTLVSPFSTQYILLDMGLKIKPLKVVLRSAKSPSEMVIDFNCKESGRCVVGNLTISNGNRYQCIIREERAQGPWQGECRKLERNTEEGPIVARMHFPAPALQTYMKKIVEVAMECIADNLEPYLRRQLNIVDQEFADDLTTAIFDSVSVARKTIGLLYSGESTMLKHLQAVAEEVFSIKSQMESENGSGFGYLKVIRSIYNYMSIALGDVGMKIPVWMVQLRDATIELYIEIGSEDPKKISLVWDTKSKSKPELEHVARVDLWYKGNKPVIRYFTRNVALWAWANINPSTMKFLQGSIGCPDCQSSINITTVRRSDGLPDGYDINFIDTEASNYTCQMRARDTHTITTHCVVRRYRARPHDVCRFDLPAQALTLPQLCIKASLLIPQMYEAAYNPTLFKNQLRKVWNVVDEHSLTVIVTFLSDKSKRIIKRFHENIFEELVNEMTGELMEAYDKSLPSAILKKIMTYPRWVGVLHGKTSLKQAYLNTAADMFDQTIVVAVDTFRKIDKTFKEVKKIVSAISPNRYFPHPISTAFSIKQLINSTYTTIKIMSDVNYVCNEVMCSPSEIKTAFRSLYNRYYVLQEMARMYFLQGPTYLYITGPSVSQVISYNGRYFKLPVIEDNSPCLYVHATEPLHNSMNIFSKGKSLLLAFPEKTVEVTLQRRVYTIDQSQQRREVQLPYVSDDVVCMSYPKKIVCSCLDYSVNWDFSNSDRVPITVNMRATRMVIGAMGIFSDEPTDTTLFLPDGSRAQNPGQLLNGYALTKSQQCRVPEQELESQSGEVAGDGLTFCRTVFDDPQMNEAKSLFPKLADQYFVACVHGASSIQTACVDANQFIKRVRERGYKVPGSSKCSNCKVGATSTQIEKAEVYIMLSLSKNTTELEPKKLVQKLVTKIMQRLREEGLEQTKMGVLSYGGKGDMYRPYLITVDGLTSTTDEEKINKAIKEEKFNGPNYAPSATRDTLEFIAREMKSAPSGIAKCILMIAPETPEKNTGSLEMSSVINEIKEDLTSVFLWSPMTDAQCQQAHENIVLQTHGRCMDVTRGTREVADAVVGSVSRKVGSQATCNCGAVNPLTGDKPTYCRMDSQIDDISF